MNSLLSRVGVITQLVLGLVVVFCFMGVIASLIYLKSDISPGVREVLLVLVGVLAGAFKDVIGFNFGSSLGSQKKDEAKKESP